MSNRWVRLLLAALALAAAAAAAYRVIQDEQRVAQIVSEARLADTAADNALLALTDLKGTLHAYVAPGQGLPFWSSRAGMLVDKLRGAILELDPTATAYGVPLAEALDSTDRLAATDQRAREHVRNGQSLLAGDLIFTDARDLIDGLRLQVARARDQIATQSSAREAETRREELLLIAGGIGVIAIVMLLLVPTPFARDVARDFSTAEAVAKAVGPATAGQGVAGDFSPATPGRDLTPATDAGDARLHDAAPATAPQDVPHGPDLTVAAAICADLSRVIDSRELPALLWRTAEVLGASGIIVWSSSTDRRTLFPVASAGYDDRIVARIGSIDREAANLTAAAFRDGATRVSHADGASAAAMAIPLPSPQGAVGVFSAELRGAPTIRADQVAVGEIFAAQLATLIGSLPSAETKTVASNE